MLLSYCSTDDIEKVKELIDSGVDINGRANPVWNCTDDFYSPLDAACQFGSTEVIKYLVDNGADVTSDSNFPIRVAASQGYAEIVGYLADKGADISVMWDKPIKSAVAGGHTATVECLLAKGVDATISDNELFMQACWDGHLEIVKCLVKFGADVTDRSHQAFREVINEGQLDIVKYLLDMDNSLFLYVTVTEERVVYRNFVRHPPNLEAFEYWSNLLSTMGKKYMLLSLLNKKGVICKDILLYVIDIRYKMYMFSRHQERKFGK